MELNPIRLTKKTKEAVLKVVECPICTEIAVPPLYQCSKGHFICAICEPKVKKCALCRKPIRNSRNFAVENIVSTMKAKCFHESCSEVLKITEMQKHMAKCVYRPVACICKIGEPCGEDEENGGTLIDWSLYAKHLEKSHKLRRRQITLGCVKELKVMAPNDILDLEKVQRGKRKDWLDYTAIPLIDDESNATFFLNTVSEYSNIFIWVTGLDSTQAKGYEVEIGIIVDNGRQRGAHLRKKYTKYTFTLDIASVHKGLHDIKKAHCCAKVKIVKSLSTSYERTDGVDEPDFYLNLTIRINARPRDS